MKLLKMEVMGVSQFSKEVCVPTPMEQRDFRTKTLVSVPSLLTDCQAKGCFSQLNIISRFQMYEAVFPKTISMQLRVVSVQLLERSLSSRASLWPLSDFHEYFSVLCVQVCRQTKTTNDTN
jgi:hypothetical protein